MLDTVLFDLDGSLLLMNQKEFIQAYLNELGKTLTAKGLDKELAIKGVWAGTGAMLKNDGAKLNHERFWENFAEVLNLKPGQLGELKKITDSFYINEFDKVKTIVKPSSTPKAIIDELKAKNYTLVLATNPLFPACAVETRLNWIDLKYSDFCLVTNYSNCSYCKPSSQYYEFIFRSIGKKPEQCLMVGNNVLEDMCAKEYGADTYLVTDFMENPFQSDINAYKHGSLDDFNHYAAKLPAL